MTETDAKGKWCPMFVASHTDPRALQNNVEGQPFAHNCIASDCALWVVDTDARFKTSPTGYCGMIRK